VGGGGGRRCADLGAVHDQHAHPGRQRHHQSDPALEEVGADIVRVSCPDTDSTAAFKTIAKAAKVPLVADIHFHYKRGIEAAEAGAACLRINPGNIGSMDRVREVVQAARDHGCDPHRRERRLAGA
jgi:4-hydroxy-3-methylbut-2-en-1-yl diphosphate synthase IspG/GcpE